MAKATETLKRFYFSIRLQVKLEAANGSRLCRTLKPHEKEGLGAVKNSQDYSFIHLFIRSKEGDMEL